MNDDVGCEQVRALAADLAIGNADGQERDAALRHTATCAECRLLVSELSSVVDDLLLLAPSHEPPPGFASRTRAQPRGRGRPAWTYQATSVLSPASEYAALAVVLSSALTRISEHPSVDAELAGEEWGRGLAHRRGAAPTTPESARDRVVELFDDFGFEPQQAPDSPSLVRLTRCPLLEAARSTPAIVCSVHLGMLRGVLDEYGADPEGSALVPFAEPGACRVVIPPVDDRP